MTAATFTRANISAKGWLQAIAVAAGMILLLARPLVAVTLGWSVPVVVVLFGVVMAFGLAAPVGPAPVHRVHPRTLATVFVAGTVIFVAGRLLSAGHAPEPASGLIVALNTLAAVGEEALFRRVAFDALLRAGPACAITGSALLFGLAHVTVYGWWAFPVDIGAGLVLGWQRWASGTWTIPAVTHALADLLVVI